MKIINAFIKKPILIIMTIILVVFLPSGLEASPEGIDLLHAVSLGIDKYEDELEISIMAFVTTSKEKFSEDFFIVTARAPAVSEALKLIGINLGKRLITIHIGIIVINQEVAIEGVMDSLNYFYRSSAITNDTFLACSTSTAKEFLEHEMKLIKESGIRLEEIGLYNENHMFISDTNIESFYRGYFSESKASLISLIELKSEEEAVQTTLGEGAGSGGQAGTSGGGQTSSSGGGQTSSSGGQTSSSGGGGSTEQKYVQNTGKAAIFYDGLFKAILNKEEMRGLNWVGDNTKDINIKIDNITDKNYENATLFFNVEGNEVKLNSYFNYNNKPVLEITVKIHLKVEQVLQEDLIGVEKNISDAKNYLTDVVRNKLEYQVKKEFSLGLQKLIENQADVLDIYKTFNCKNHSKFQEWYKRLEEPKEFLREIDYRLTVRVKATD